MSRCVRHVVRFLEDALAGVDRLDEHARDHRAGTPTDRSRRPPREGGTIDTGPPIQHSINSTASAAIAVAGDDAITSSTSPTTPARSRRYGRAKHPGDRTVQTWAMGTNQAELQQHGWAKRPGGRFARSWAMGAEHRHAQ